MGSLELSREATLLDGFIRLLEFLLEILKRVDFARKPTRAQCRPFAIRYYQPTALLLDRAVFDLHKRARHRVVRCSAARVPKIVDPSCLELQQRVRPPVQQPLQRLHLPTHADALHAQVHRLEILRQCTFAPKMRRKLGDHNSARWDRMNQFQREELPSTDEAFVIPVDEIERQNGEQVGEEQMD